MKDILEARFGRLKTLLAMSNEGPLSQENKVKFHQDLETLIAAGEEEICREDLAYLHNLRGQVHAGFHRNVCA